MKTEKALITGGAGFIGSHLVDDLIKNGYEVMIVDNLLSGKKENISDIVSNNIFYDDIGSDQVLQNIIEFDPDICFHLAAQSSVVISVEDPLLDFEHNLLQPIKLLQKLISTDCKKFVFSSSGGTIFGEPNVIPTSEKDYAGEPASPYGVAKKKLNEFIMLMLEDQKMSYSILNLANVYGPRQDPHGEAGVMSIFTGKMLNNEIPIVYGDGKQTRDYIFVTDVVSALIKSSEIDENLFLNIGTSKETTVNELVSLIGSITSWKGKPDYKPQRDGELLRSVLNNEKAKKSLDWEPEYNINKGIEELVDWFKNE